MRKRIYNWQGQRFAYIWLEGEPGQSLEKQSQGLFDRAGPELASLGLALDKNVVRTRVYGRTRDARNIVERERQFARGRGGGQTGLSLIICPLIISQVWFCKGRRLKFRRNHLNSDLS